MGISLEALASATHSLSHRRNTVTPLAVVHACVRSNPIVAARNRRANKPDYSGHRNTVRTHTGTRVRDTGDITRTRALLSRPLMRASLRRLRHTHSDQHSLARTYKHRTGGAGTAKYAGNAKRISAPMSQNGRSVPAEMRDTHTGPYGPALWMPMSMCVRVYTPFNSDSGISAHSRWGRVFVV